MIKPRLNKIIELLIECTYLGAIFLVPLYFSIVPKTINVFELNKIVLFRILSLLLLFFYFINILLKNYSREEFFKLAKHKVRYLYIPSIYLLGWSILTFFSFDLDNSFWGSYDRQLGLLTYIFLYLFLVLLVLYIERKEQVYRILYTISFSAFFVCVYGLVQAFGVDPLNWIEETKFRISSSLGQPNFFASYLLLVMPISWFLVNKIKNRFAKIFIFLSSLLQFFCLVLTYSRAAELGFLFSVFVFLLFFIFFRREKKNVFNFKKSIYFTFIIISIIFLSWFYLPADQKTRIKWIFDFTQGSTASRIDYWESSISAIREKPFFGYGLENQKEVLVSFYEKDWAIFNNVNSSADRAHNIFFDNLLTGGFFGLFLYLFLNFYFVKMLIINIRENRYKNLSFYILFSWASYTISLMFGFAVIVTELYFWLYLAVAIILSSIDKQNSVIKSQDKNNFLIFKIFLIIIFAVGIFYQLNREIKKIVADHYFYKIESSLMNKEYFTAFLLYDWLLELEIETRYYDQKIAKNLSRLIEKNTKETWSEGAKKLILPKIVQNIQSEKFDDICTRAKIYTAMASEENKGFFAKAEEAFILCIEKSKQFPENYREFAKYYFKKGDYDKAIENLNLSLSYLPDLDDKRINKEHAFLVKHEIYLINILFGDIYSEKEEYEKSRNYYYSAKNNYDDLIFTNKKIADSFYLEGKKEDTLRVLKEIKKNDKDNYFWDFLIAQIYLEQGKNEIAKEYADKALVLSPKNKKIMQFIDDLN